MDGRSPECSHKTVSMFSATQLFVTSSISGGGGGGGGRKRTGVLSGIIVWNLVVLVLLVLAVCVQGLEEVGQGGAVSSSSSSHVVMRRSPQSGSVKKEGVGSTGPTQPAGSPTVPPQGGQSQDTNAKVNEGSEGKEGAVQGGQGGGDTQLTPEDKDKTGYVNATAKEDSDGGSLPSHMPSMSTEAVLRAFYVFVGIGAILLIYIVVKLVRLRRRRATGKYRVLSHTDDQEMFPLAAGEGEDEEIFNAAHHQPRK